MKLHSNSLLIKLCWLSLGLGITAVSGLAIADTKPVINIGYVQGWSDSGNHVFTPPISSGGRGKCQ